MRVEATAAGVALVVGAQLLLELPAAFAASVQGHVCKPRNKTVIPFSPLPTPVDPPRYGPILPHLSPYPTTEPITEPTKAPYASPTSSPTKAPTLEPNSNPTSAPTSRPTKAPVSPPPSRVPTKAPFASPTSSPTKSPVASPTSQPTIAPSPGPVEDNCPQFKLDFYDVAEGTYLTDELEPVWGVTIHAKYRRVGNNKGFTPSKSSGYTQDSEAAGGAARVFDSAFPEGDIDLGAPHHSCGGPGEGNDGAEGQPYENCLPQGKVLVIQELNNNNQMHIVDDHAKGGTISFTFTKPATVDYVTVFDGDGSEDPEYIIEFADGSTTTLPSILPGDNGVNQEAINLANVKVLTFSTKGSGGLSEIAYRLCPDNVPAAAPALVLPPSTKSCGCVTVDMDDVGNGWIELDDYLDNKGVLISAYPRDHDDGLATGDRARIFRDNNQDKNHATQAGLSLASTVDGDDKVLIIKRQGSSPFGKDIPAEHGGGIRFKFTEVVYLQEIKIMDTDYDNDPPYYLIVKADHTIVRKPASVTVSNIAANREAVDFIDEDHVREVWVMLRGPGAIAHIKYKRPC